MANELTRAPVRSLVREARLHVCSSARARTRYPLRAGTCGRGLLLRASRLRNARGCYRG
jgi:hypothetical protein